MRIFLAGAAGAVGRRLVPMLVAAGHEVVGTTRSAARVPEVAALGAEPVVLDALDAAAVRDAVAAAAPEVLVHQLTALSGPIDLRHFERTFAATNRLRTEGTDNLLAAARAAGVRLVVAQSFAGWPADRTGGPVATEDAPFDPDPAAPQTLAAIRHLETAVAAYPGIVLRYGGFYGPGTSLAGDGGEVGALLRKRAFPLVGGGTGVWSFCHVTDAASATVVAIGRGTPGTYAVCDDEPAPVAEWLPVLAARLGAPRPLRVPAWLVRPLLGAQGTLMMTASRGASNAKAKRELGWTPAYPSWREGFRTGL